MACSQSPCDTNGIFKQNTKTYGNPSFPLFVRLLTRVNGQVQDLPAGYKLPTALVVPAPAPIVP